MGGGGRGQPEGRVEEDVAEVTRHGRCYEKVSLLSVLKIQAGFGTRLKGGFYLCVSEEMISHFPSS